MPANERGVNTLINTPITSRTITHMAEMAASREK
jgi:hypothetical protein